MFLNGPRSISGSIPFLMRITSSGKIQHGSYRHVEFSVRKPYLRNGSGYQLTTLQADYSVHFNVA